MNSLTPEVYNSLFEVANPEDFELFGISLDESAPRENITPNQWREYDELLDQQFSRVDQVIIVIFKASVMQHATT